MVAALHMEMRTAALLALLVSSSAHATVYQCVVSGQKVFSDKPCAADAKEVVIKTPPASGGSGMVTDGTREWMKGRESERQIRDLDREIERRRAGVATLRRAMDDALLDWQRQKSLANNNLAGATWEAAAQEADVIRQRFQSQIDEELREIDRLRDQRDRLAGSP